MSWRRTGALVTLLLVAAATPATAREPDPWDRARDVPPRAAEASVKDLAPQVYDLSPQEYDLAPNVESLQRQSVDGGEQVVALNTDILFEFAKADLPSSTAAALGGTVAAVPRGATLKVEGHTDSVGTDAANQELSQNRAQAVATAIGQARPDLTLQVTGFGETRPVAPNEAGGKDNPAGRTLNRRVELRFTP